MGEFIVELLLTLAEPILEGVMEGIVDSADCLIPGKRLSNNAKKAIALVLCIVGLAMLILLIVGIVYLVQNKGQSPAGWIMLSAALSYALLLTLWGVVIRLMKRRRKRKAKRLD